MTTTERDSQSRRSGHSGHDGHAKLHRSDRAAEAARRSLVAIIPALDEEASIERVIHQTRDCAKALDELGIDLSICVMDDGSSDATADIARKAGADEIISHTLNRGCGAAVRSGLIYGRDHDFDILVKLDADGQHEPADIPGLITPILEDRADVVYGDRFPGLSYRMPFVRRVGNSVFRRLMRWLTRWDIKDSQPGMFAVNASYLKVSFIPGDYNYTQQVLLDSYLNGMRFDQVPITFHQRNAGTSFISLAYPMKVLPAILMLMVSIRPLRVFLPLAAIFLVAAAGVSSTEVALWMAGHGAKPVEHVNLVTGLGMFGLNTGFFGLLAELVVQRRR